ncbi:MAG: hypothetical protein VB070_01725 [Clostridiaceae bacterium]|nr:hypothetical protein [Clostridiaceae bacterium]
MKSRRSGDTKDKGLEPLPIGSYRGFAMSLTVEDFGRDLVLTLKGQMSHRVSLGKDARGNLTRIDNALAQMPERLATVQSKLDNTYQQIEAAKAELGKPFPQDAELAEKSVRLAKLNIELDMAGKTPQPNQQTLAKTERSSLLERIKTPYVSNAPTKKKTHEIEER